MSLGSKISVAVSLIVIFILAIGTWLIWDKLDSWELQRAHLLVAAWTMFGVGGAVYFAVRHLTQPLSELTELATQLGEGHLERRFRVETHDEIGRLGRALDGMARSLEAARDNLESEVAARTEELRRSQKQLQQAARMAAVGELAAGVAHEINNPAGTILMRAGQLSQSLADAPTEIREDLAVIQRQVDKIGLIVAGLLSFSRRTESSGELISLDINEVVQRTAHLMEGMLRSRKVEVELGLADHLPRVSADGARIEQVLLNLVNNAVDAMPEGGRLTFGSRVAADGSVQVTIADTGVGIAPEHLGRVFDPFFTTKDPGQGTGLGLSVSYAIVEQHGGSIEVASDAGRGTCFTLSLPALDPDPVPGDPADDHTPLEV